MAKGGKKHGLAAKVAAQQKSGAKAKETVVSAEEIAQQAIDEAEAEAASAAGIVKDDDVVIRPGEAKGCEDTLLEGIVVTAAHPRNQHENARDIKVENMNLTLYGLELIVDAELTLNWGRRYGLLGRNGCGKSTLLTVLGRRLVPMPASIDSYHLVSECEPSDMSALDAVLSVDTERQLLEAQAEALSSKLPELETDAAALANDRLCEIYERLDEMESDTAAARAAAILHGLGFTTHMQEKKTREFSGGWRMRIALARALFLKPCLLLLDEPTNHLDMEAVVWLESYLAEFGKILVIISHSQDFLNNVCTNIIHFTEKKLEYYTGNYDQYCQTRAEKEEFQMKRFNWEQDQIKHMKEYIARFGHGSAKLARQAQSKEKTLAKMERSGLTERVKKESSLSMRFSDPGTIPPPVLQLQGVTFGYPGRPPLYCNVDFGIDLDSRIALVGPNGAGKTTLLKLICGELIPTSGNIRPHPHLQIARYTQHFVDTLDLTVAPLEHMRNCYKEEEVDACRSYLGRFGVTGEFQTKKIALLSDGIKSRVVFAMMAKQNPHLLLLDEPTNHLDIETIDSLAEAINCFTGGMVLVSHDMRLISQVAREIWEVEHQTIRRFTGGILEYKRALQIKMRKASAALAAGASAAGAAAAAQGRGAGGGRGGASGGARKK